MAAPLDDPSKWATGADDPTEKQINFINSLAEQKGAEVDTEHLTKSEASMKIEELKSASAGGGGGGNGSASSGDEPRSTTTGSDKLPSELPADETSPPADSHLAHPETWTTGGEPATDKQKGFIHVLAKQAGVEDPVPEQMSKSEASEAIEDLKKK